MTLSIQSMRRQRNFRAFNKQAIKLTAAPTYSSYTITFCKMLGFLLRYRVSLLWCDGGCVRVFFSSLYLIRVVFVLRIRLVDSTALANYYYICFHVQWGENNIDKRSIRIS